jgi:hypothetical protein
MTSGDSRDHTRRSWMRRAIVELAIAGGTLMLVLLGVIPLAGGTAPSNTGGPRPLSALNETPWDHDHSSAVIPRRPVGQKQLRTSFGKHCNKRTNDGRAWFPSAAGRGVGGYVYFHRRLAANVGHNVLGHIGHRDRKEAVDYGVWGYACRLKTGGTSWSVHSWGAAIDTNTLRNPWGQTWWNGKGSNGRPYRKYLPRVWMQHNFYWGLFFSSTKDPMHFQYVTGY